MYIGPPADDLEILARLPALLRGYLEQTNGYVAYHGGLHLRGASREPAWHSLRAAWEGPAALHRLYPEVRRDDVPFAEDALGDQFLLRGGIVHRLSGETGEIESLGLDLAEFDAAVRADPFGYLALAPLEEFRAQGGVLTPGQLLSVYPPFVIAESANGVSYRAVDAVDRRRWLADLARRLHGIPDGTRIDLTP